MHGKEIYHEWFHNDTWDGICENENFEGNKDGNAIDEVDKSALVPPTNTKELALWKIKYHLLILKILHYGKARTRRFMP